MNNNISKNHINLEDLGYDAYFENFRLENNLESYTIGRISSEHKERYTVKTTKGDFEAEIMGNLRYASINRRDFPAVGDWVAVSEYDEGKLLIHKVYPRKTILERPAIGKFGEKQIIATNIDYAFIVISVDRDFSINRIERYLTICDSSNVKPIVVISKVDLVNENGLSEITDLIDKRIHNILVITISNKTQIGIEDIKNQIIDGKTYCFLGSSGVGKSTLINTLTGNYIMKTCDIGDKTNRGKHVTSHRELFVLASGGILIDNPGMREVGITSMNKENELSFNEIDEYAKDCKFKDCSHTHEKGCAVINAVNEEIIDKASYENYLRMKREQEHFESTEVEKRRKGKDFAKMVKQVKRLKNK